MSPQSPEAFAAGLEPGRPLLGLDLGTKTIGVALSDRSLTIASGVTTIKRSKFRQDAETLAALIDEHQVGGIVIGLPLNMDGSKGPRVQATLAFERNFTAVRAIPFLLWDERLSTVAAERAMLEADMSRASRARNVDKVAATIILQSALDRLTALR